MGFDLWMTSNSPGEVSTWVGGVVPWLRKLRPHWRIRLALVPCPYASGAEKSVAERIEGLDEVLSPWETTRWYLGLSRRATAPRGLVMFLGGDPWHALLMKHKLGYPAYGYFEHPTFWTRWFDARAFAYPQDGEPALGNLMVDRVGWNPPRDPGQPFRVGLFPGSRAWHAALTLGPMLAAVEDLGDLPLEWTLVQSPFLSDTALQKAMDRPFPLGLPTRRGELVEGALILPSGQRIRRRPGGGGLEDLDAAFTLPGTNTAELACAGIPFAVVLHPLAFIGGGGLSGLLERLPLPNRWKTPLRMRRHRRLGFTALPNQRAGRFIAPEVVLDRSMDPLTQHLRRWFQDPEEVARIRAQLRGVMGEPGATRRLAEWMIEGVEAKYAR